MYLCQSQHIIIMSVASSRPHKVAQNILFMTFLIFFHSSQCSANLLYHSYKIFNFLYIIHIIKIDFRLLLDIRKRSSSLTSSGPLLQQFFLPRCSTETRHSISRTTCPSSERNFFLSTVFNYINTIYSKLKLFT